MNKLWLIAALVVSCTEPKQGRVGTVVPSTPAEPAEPAEPEAELHECGRQRAAIAGVADVSVLLVIDRSSSMSHGSKWAETRAAVATALGAHDRYLRFGLLLYPSGPDVCDAVDGELDVPMALGNGSTISAAMADADIFRGTPTGAALRAAGDLLGDVSGEHRVVVLATDGRPDCTAEGWDNGSGLAATEAYDATNDLAESGVPVYVVGIQGSSSARAVLSRIADIGGTAKSGDTAFYETTSGAELAQALVDIARDVDGCTVHLEPHDDAVLMEVSLDGQPLRRDPDDGWDLHDGRLHIYAAGCLAAPGEVHQVEVTWYCEPAG